MLNLLLVFVPVAFVLEYIVHAADTLIFAASAIAVLPLAGLMGRATEELAARTGSAIGGLLNATFGTPLSSLSPFSPSRRARSTW